MALLAYQQFPLEQVFKWGTVGKANKTKAEWNIPIIFHNKVDSTWKKRPFGDYIENCHITMRGVASWSLGGNLILSVSFVSNIYMSERGPGVGYNTNRYTPAAWRRDTASTSFILFIMIPPFQTGNIYFLGFSRVVTWICSRPCSRCIFAEYKLALDKYEGYLASKFT